MPSVQTVSDLTFAVDTVAKFKPHAVVVTKRFYSTKKSDQEKSAIELANLEKGKLGLYNGHMSPSTRRQVKGIIENSLTAVQLCTKLNFPKNIPSEHVFPTFVTLTLPVKQVHSDEDLRRYCFGPFIQYMTGDKEKGLSGWGVKAYLWVAETQANGNLHFHVLIDRAVPWRRIRDAWNRCLERLKYISDHADWQRYIYRKGFYVRPKMVEHAVAKAEAAHRAKGRKWGKKDRKAVVQREEERQQKAYNEGVAKQWRDPNTTDIHAIQNIKKLTAYVTKYMTKEPERAYRREDGQMLTKLADTQKIVEKDGQTLIETVVVEPWVNYATGETGSYTFHRSEVVQVVMLRRRMRGRIWGRADCLAQPDPESDTERPLLRPFEATVKRTERHDVTDHKTATRSVTRWVVTGTDLYGQPVSHRVVSDETTTWSEPQPPRWVHEENPAWNDYLEHLRGIVPKEDRDKATEKAGAHFAEQGGEIIPLRTPQKDLLRKHSADVYRPYFEHYARIFRILWGEEVDPPSGARPQPLNSNPFNPTNARAAA